ncbi:hypothetical protein JB92DRAFT_3103000 [Gautieria morchelliformis]|nr:hypothetical protein JB92DRAFT_3103000 [Gautieria morchelliformis]
MKRSLISERVASITIPGDRDVVAGGTQGNGEGIACRFAQAGAEVWILGRNEAKGNLAGERDRCCPEHHFINADFSLFAEAKHVAHDIRTRAGPAGSTNSTYIRTSEGIEQHFDVQVLSRFVLGYVLTVDAYPVVKKGVMTVMKPASRCGCRSATSLHFSRRTPSVTFTHVQPSAVKTVFASNASLPWYLSSFLNVRLAVMGQTPACYPEVPFYLLVNPVGFVATSSVRFWDEHADEMAGNPAFQDEGSRAAHL